MLGRVDGPEYVVGVDLGGTKIAAARVSMSGTAAESVQVPTPGLAGPEAILDACAEVIRKTIAMESVLPRAIGVGSAGTIDATSGRVVASTDVLRGWTGTDIVAGLRSRLEAVGVSSEIPISVENDVNAHGLGELWQGAGKGKNSAVVLALGTGIGGAVLHDGRIVSGARHAGGDFGHIPSPFAAGHPCTCGKEGHLEAVASGPNIARLYNNEAEHFGLTQVARAQEVFSRALQEEPAAVAVLSWAAQAVGEALASITCVLDPEVIILAGGVAHAEGSFLDQIRAAFVERTVHGHSTVPIVEAQLGGSAPIIGAARHAINSLSDSQTVLGGVRA